MGMTWETLMRCFVATTIVALLLTGCRPLRPTETVDVSGKQTASFLKDQNLAGKVALIQFGSIDCSLSEAGLTNMVFLRRENKIPGLSYLRIEETPDQNAADTYFAQMSPGFPVYTDSNTLLARAFHATTYPCYVLVDKFGHVRHRGSFPSERLSEWAGRLNAEEADLGADAVLLDSIQLDIPTLLAQTRLPELGGGSAKSLAEYKGKRGLMLVFVDTSCPFAKQIIGDMPAASVVLSRHQVNALLVNIDDEEQDVKDFYRKQKITGPVAYDAGPDTRLKWRVESVPTIVLVSASDELLYRGAGEWEKVARACEKGLKLRAGSVVFESKGTEFG